MTLSHNITLVDLLNKNKTFALQGKSTTNHCPMALTALAAMGATPDRLQAFFTYWSERYALPAIPAKHNVTYAEFPAYVGRKESFADLQECFAARMIEKGIAPVVREVLQAIPFAPATTAFHALIRLAYGLQVEHRLEIAAGLAALVVTNFKIEINMRDRRAASTVNEGFRILSNAMGGKKYVGRMIVEKMQAVIDDVQFHQSFQAMPVSEELMDELALWAISAYWQTKDFTILHMVTGINAAREILPFLDERQIAIHMRDLWLALCVAYVSVGAPELESVDACLNRIVSKYTYLASWSELFAQAMRSNDDHVIKFTYTCSREAHLRPNALYQAAVMDLLAAHDRAGV